MDYEKLRKFRNSRNTFARELGIRTVKICRGYARAELEIEERHMNFVHSVHGGCLFSLADTVGGAAASSSGYYSTTVDGDIHYLHAAAGNRKLIAEAREIKQGKRISVYAVEIRDDTDTLIATGTFSYYHLKKKIEE